MTSTSADPAVRGFNEADRSEVVERLTACLDVPRWVEQVEAGRPYRDVEALLDAAASAADPLEGDEVERALSHHPRLGERAATTGASAQMSAREQGAMGADAPDGGDAAAVAERLRAGNAAYEERFGHVFLLRAAGRSAGEVLEILEQRLARSAEQERATTAEQLREIALLRLGGVLTS